MSKKVLITGASGLLGRAIFREFEGEGSWQVLGLAFSRATEKLRKVDLINKESVTQVINDFKSHTEHTAYTVGHPCKPYIQPNQPWPYPSYTRAPSVVIHSAAERRPDVVEKREVDTKNLNVIATRNLCKAAASVGAWVLYISTDYVFDGKNPPYSETAEPNPLNKYGQSKLDGEKATLETSADNSVLRVPILYGEVEYLGESAVTVLFEKVKVTDSQCVMSDYERRYPTSCADVAFVIRELSDNRIKNPNIKGIYHWSSNENMTKYDMAAAMAEAFGWSTDHIKADKNPSGGAPRPFNSHLSCGRLEELGIGKWTLISKRV
ncbi:hypothetical protein KUTeg_024170 [Tegillarca granosa]|uniref:Methionine adenosyltransferase 2 subunit beta n=1 Tax=Tegillarca granosa TaxID=220873 RepID=A0ABQ9DX41_TEGGR|nr:hypothetical protein KUTeg_024170 [Tegillarca granosa]